MAKANQTQNTVDPVVEPVIDPVVDPVVEQTEFKVLILTDCPFGKCLDVVTLNAEDFKAAKAQGMIDPAESAVAWGEARIAEAQ